MVAVVKVLVLMLYAQARLEDFAPEVLGRVAKVTLVVPVMEIPLLPTSPPAVAAVLVVLEQMHRPLDLQAALVA